MSGLIERFGHWFASVAAVAWITGVTTAAVIAEHLFPRMDPSGYQFLYWVTWASWVTQPVLAYVGMLGARKTDKVLARLEAMERREIELLEQRDVE